MSDPSPEQSLEEILGLRPESASAPPSLPVAGESAKPKYGIFALLCPFAGMAAAVLLSFMIPAESLGGTSERRGVAMMGVTLLPASVAGIVLAVRAIARREAWFGADIFAVLLNVVTAGTTAILLAVQVAGR